MSFSSCSKGMGISRRTLLRRFATGAAASAVVPAFTHSSLSAEVTPPVWSVANASGPVRLHLSENAYGASPRAIAAIHDAARLVNRYPDASEGMLRRQLADLHNVAPGQIVLGCGSSEILRLAATAFAGAGRKVVVAQPTFELMAGYARAAGAEVVAVPLRSDYAHDLDAVLSRVGGSAALVYICNPNNPTGSLTRRHDLETFLARLPDNVYALIDEAYHHYVGGSSEYASFIDRPIANPRVVVVRSFSAIYGLAGLRVGYAVAGRRAADLLRDARLPDSVNALGAAAAAAALNDPEHVRLSARRNADERQEFCNQANARMLRTIDSHANFVMLNTGHSGADMVEHFKKHGVLVAGPYLGFEKYIRISIGTPAEMTEFWRVWDLLPPMHAMTM
jgi:histidinol-phosphate aminotransferase